MLIKHLVLFTIILATLLPWLLDLLFPQDGHVDVARLLLDHGAHVNMPKDSFESPLTLASCGGHYDLAALLISRGAQLEETNDEG